MPGFLGQVIGDNYDAWDFSCLHVIFAIMAVKHVRARLQNQGIEWECQIRNACYVFLIHRSSIAFVWSVIPIITLVIFISVLSKEKTDYVSFALEINYFRNTPPPSEKGWRLRRSLHYPPPKPCAAKGNMAISRFFLPIKLFVVTPHNKTKLRP